MTLSPPIFIVGAPHSGTSILLTILGTHSRIHPIPSESLLAFQDADTQIRLIQSFCEGARGSGKQRWVEKTPRHLEKLDTLWGLLPKALVVVIMRDGRDVACSFGARTGDFYKGMEQWVEAVRLVEALGKHPQVFHVKYEEIVEDFESTLTRLLSFLGEEYEPCMKDFHLIPRHYYSSLIENPRDVRKHEQHRNWQINQPLFNGRGRWETDMTLEQQDLFKKEAGDMLVRQGYVSDCAWGP